MLMVEPRKERLSRSHEACRNFFIFVKTIADAFRGSKGTLRDLFKMGRKAYESFSDLAENRKGPQRKTVHIM